MVEILSIDIPDKLTTFVRQVLDEPERFCASACKRQDSVDPYTPSLPILSDDFIRSRDKNLEGWNGVSLTTARFKHVCQIPIPPMRVMVPVIHQLETILTTSMQQIRGNFFYPEGGYMGWHTNSDLPGTRVYMSYAEQENQSYFKYVNDDSIIISPDVKGWTVRKFVVGNTDDTRLWHCISAHGCRRISFGFLFK
jgi:hypothetical protein